jgi:hypothetical protein
MLPCLLEDGECRAFGIKTSTSLTRLVFNSIVAVRALFIRCFCLPRHIYDLRTPFYPNKEGKYIPHYFVYNAPFYTEGYRIEELGPEKFMPKCPVFHSSS